MQEKNENYKVTNLVGVPTDYSDENNWAYLPENTDKAVDTFFIYPTLYINPEPDAPAIVSIDDPMIRKSVDDFYLQVPVLFEDLTNLYEPFYRQSNLCALTGRPHEELVEF